MTVLLELKNLSKRFGGVVAIDELDLTINDGQLLCIIGPNGCGKTTLFNLISGEVKSNQGGLFFKTVSLKGLKPFEIAKAGIVRKFQVPSVFSELTVFENLRVACNVKSGALNEIEKLMQEVSLHEQENVVAGTLSHGQKQWLEIAMVLACEPKLLLLDEPTAGMTRAETHKTVELIKTIHKTHDIAMIVIEHDMSFVEALDCTVAAMVAGQIIAIGNYDEIASHEIVREAYLGTPA